MSKWKLLLPSLRLPFLILTPPCVFLGLGTALSSTERVSLSTFLVVLIGAVSAHMSVNAFNEYFDFKSGLDFTTERTLFSGGSGTLPAHPHCARPVLAIACATFAVTCVIGLYLLSLRGIALLPLGLLGLFAVAAYTPWLARHPFLCLIAPGAGFGPLMVMGTDFALTGAYSWSALTASLVPFFLVNNLLLLNQFPDVEADRRVGRKNIPIVIGRRGSSVLYGLLLLFAYLSIAAGVYYNLLSVTSLIGMGTIVLALPAAFGAYRYAEEVKKLSPYMGLNVGVAVITPMLVAIGLLVG